MVNRRGYTPKQIVELIQMVEAEGIWPVHKRTGISRTTLRRWVENKKVVLKEHADEVELFQEQGAILVTTREDLLEKHNIDYLDQAIRLKEEGIQKLRDLIRKANDPDHIPAVSNAIKIVHETITPKEKQPDSTVVNNIQQIFQAVDSDYKHLKGK